MITSLLLLVVGVGAESISPPSQLPAIGPEQEWRMTWNDEFDGATLDESKWERNGDSPRRDGFWIKDDAYLDGKGCLVLRTRKDGDRYTCGAVRTKGKFEHRYGFWEARCQFPKQQGHWPAFWLMPREGLKDAEVGGAAGAEIDIMEKAWLTEKVSHALHWDGYGVHHKSDAREVEQPGLNGGFHTFAVWWTPEEYVFYIDGRETWRTKGGGASQALSYIKLTEEIGPWAGKITEAKLPDYFVVDYVRVYDLVPKDGTGVFGAYAPSREYTPPQDPAVLRKLSEWQDEKLGLLITWGTYSQWGIVESWTLCPERFEWNRRTGPFANDDHAYKASYEQLMTTFNPGKFDPDKWAAAIKGGGVKYVLVMAKHHDGFCMFDTATTDYRITSPRCPFHTDPRSNVLKEMSAAFRKEGLSTGVYFSKADWNTSYYWSPDFPLRDRNVNYDTAKHPDIWNAFKEFTWKQIDELMTGYGPQDILWLDGGQVRPPEQDIDVSGMAAMARKHQPGLIVVDRTVRGENENYITPEQEIPDHFLPYPWETCMTMGTSWSWKQNDQYKSTGTLIRHMCTIAARGGNLLLGIGPDANGEFDPTVYSRLEEMGQWLKLNGEALYATRPIAPYEQSGCVFTQKRDGTAYAIILPKEDNGALPEFVSLPLRLITDKSRFTMVGFDELTRGETKGEEVVLAIPEAVRNNPPCKHAWAIKITSKET